VRVWLEARPRLRSLNITFQRLDGRPVYVLENPASSAYYRAGEREYRFLERLDGTRTVAQVLARQPPGTGLEPDEAIRFLELLRSEGLLDEPNVSALSRAVGGPGWLERIGGVLFWRISFGNPDRFFAWLAAVFGWAVHPLAWLAGLGLIAAGALTLLRHADRARDATLGVLAPDQWIWFALIFGVLRAIHEIWHGLTCRRLGGRVRDIGVVLIVFFPLGYTDVTSGWGMPSRWHRFLISVAGVFIELCLAAAAALVWADTGPGLVNTLAWQVVLTAGASSLLANLNPLMRFDGYYILTDLLDLPNLYTRGQILWRALLRRWVLGVREQPLPPLLERRWRAAVLYGPAAFAWRLFVMVNLLAAAGALFRGAGIALVCILLLVWIRRPLRRAVAGLRGMSFGRWVGATVRILLLAGALGGALLIPWRTAPVEPALVDWADRCDVYAGCSGILAEAAARPGTSVEAGTELARIENPDLPIEADRLRVKTAKQELLQKIALREDDLPAWTAARAAESALQDEYGHARRRADQRIVSAPQAGVVYSRRLDRRLGQYIKEGEPLLTLGHASDREAVALISQERLARYGLRAGDRAEVWVPGRARTWTGAVAAISPTAGRRIERPALTALGGGHLAVQPRAPGDAEAEAGYELHDPQFEVRVRLTAPDAAELNAGERAYLRAAGGVSIPLWRLTYGRLERFWGDLVGRRPRA
jgi:putative peptide zinc metalloprotease protein